jgi:DNA-binding NarL/FixJ family response regulator
MRRDPGSPSGRPRCCARTVENHVQSTLRKLQLHNRVELARYAIEHGLAGDG